MVEEIGVAREAVKRAPKTLREKGFIRSIGSDKTSIKEVKITQGREPQRDFA